MNSKNLAITLATFVFLTACDVGNNSHIKLKNDGDHSSGYPNYINRRKVGIKNHIPTNHVVSYCKEFMQYEMGIPSNSQWSSAGNITESTSGWQWQGWVEFDGERSNFICNIDNNEVTAYFHKETYPDYFPDRFYGGSDRIHNSNISVVSSCKEFMQYEMGIPSNGGWSSTQNVTKTAEGWQWRGWVNIDGERNKFVCTVDNNGVRVATNFEDSYNYEYEYNYTY
ncbi:MAG: hypothetical protein F6K18_20565 [Okeania sp. SIO2C2]|uniref:hypothetical protein n=1 Tax=Okeania sp. SIO2C2 TaxID=2607787 RepID=UPI0013B9F5F8|nr:hypothetical protein [Okeania sp. SIO2C2]NEP89030.1 hypothetical protein [Okeania sp. SIO2C2]